MLREKSDKSTTKARKKQHDHNINPSLNRQIKWASCARFTTRSRTHTNLMEQIMMVVFFLLFYSSSVIVYELLSFFAVQILFHFISWVFIFFRRCFINIISRRAVVGFSSSVIFFCLSSSQSHNFEYLVLCYCRMNNEWKTTNRLFFCSSG